MVSPGGLGTDFEIGWSGRIGEGGEWEEEGEERKVRRHSDG